MAEDVYLTRKFFHNLHDELEVLKKERIKISGEIEVARQQGDLSENAEYDAAREAQGHNEARISELEDVLARTKIIEDQNIPGDKIYIGAIATLKDLKKDEEVRYILVAQEESNFDENKISVQSPIGKSLLGHAVGEKIAVEVPSGNMEYEVLNIERP